MSYLLTILFLTGCKKPPEAPEELNELTRYLYREWNNEDPLVMEAGVQNLYNFLEDLDLEGDLNDRAFLVEPPLESDLVDIDRPEERDPQDCYGISVAGVSVWPVRDHARLQIESDQLPMEGSAKEYIRSFPDTDDPDCFRDEGCAVLVTENEVERTNLFISVEFVLYKDLRWVQMLDEDVEGSAIIARSWTDQTWVGEGGDSFLYQSFSLDTWLGINDDETWRFQLIWSEGDVGVSEDLVVNAVKVTANNTFKDAEDVIEEFYH